MQLVSHPKASSSVFLQDIKPLFFKMKHFHVGKKPDFSEVNENHVKSYYPEIRGIDL